MVWAKRVEPAPPTVRFDDLRGWKMTVAGGAEASLQPTRAQNVWDRPVARLRYRGDGQAKSQPSVSLVPPQPIPLPETRTALGDAALPPDCVEMWVFGNRWDWVNPPGTPPLRITIHLRDAAGKPFSVPVDTVRWEEWWLLHRKLPAGIVPPATLERIELAGGWQKEWREIFLDSLRFYAEVREPLRFKPRPARNLALFPGQEPGANTGSGRLPFPTREETILPQQLTAGFTSTVEREGTGFGFTYRGKDCRLVYRFGPADGLAGIRAEIDGKPVGRLMDGGSVVTEGGATNLLGVGFDGRVVHAKYADGTELFLSLVQKSLVVDVINRTRRATEIRFGRITGVVQPRAIYVPPITYGGTNPTVLLSKAGARWAYASIWPDWYRSNGSELYGAEFAGADTAQINGGIRYLSRTDGTRNPMYERIFVTVSPRFEEVLPVVANPVGMYAREAVGRLWQQSWGPDDYAKQMARSRMLRGYGIRELIQCNHEIAWRDNGESFTLRTHAAPKKGGDEALVKYVAHQRSLGWMSGLYTNYTDFAPVNAHWSPDFVQRDSVGEWRSAWPRCWALKPLAAVQLDAELAPQVKRLYDSNSAYTDVHTAVSPWGYTDFDARVPGAATFAQTFYAYGELLRNDSRVYGGPIFSEGTYQWLYAGLADGNYGHTYNGRSLATTPLLPTFDLEQIHSKECDIGVSWTSQFCDAIPNWRAPENIDRAIDRFLLTTLAYGHIGWLVEEEHGIQRTCRSYYMLQQVQARYGLKRPRRLAYWDGARLRSVSEALPLDLPSTRRQLYVEYPGGLQLWLNDHPSEDWIIHAGGRAIVLPPAGWAAWQPGPNGLLATSAREAGGRADYLRSAAYTYLDGRGRWFSTAEAATDGALAIYPAGANRLIIIRTAGETSFVIRRPYGVHGVAVSCRTFDAEGKRLADAILHESGAETTVECVKGAVRYELAYSGKAAWYIVPVRPASAPGSRVPLHVLGASSVTWRADGGVISGGVLTLPFDAQPGSRIRVTASSGGEQRETDVRVCAPIELHWQTRTVVAGTRLDLRPRWRLSGLDCRQVVLQLAPSDGFTVSPREIVVPVPTAPAAFALPSELPVTISSTLPAGGTGTLTVRLTGIPRTFVTRIPLSRAQEPSLVTDLARQPFGWGIARRGGKETPDSAGSGAIAAADESMAVGGATRRGLFMHPPYTGGVGYTWAELAPVELPRSPCRFHAFVGIRDGGDASDGVLFRVEVIDAAGAKIRAGELLGVQARWQELSADLSAYAGQRVRIRLIADVGPNDNSTADWGCWGEPSIQLTVARVVTQAGPSP